MVFYVGMIGSALKGEVQGDFNLKFLRGGLQGLEIRERAEGGMNGLVATFDGADGPGTAGVSGLKRSGIIFSLTVIAADGMDRREIQNVEAHFSDVGEASDAIAEGSGFGGIVGARAREHFIPRAEDGFGAFYFHPQLFFVVDRL